MILSTGRKLLQINSRCSRPHVYFLQCSSPRSLSSIVESSIKPSLTQDYLINSCGLRPEKAILASQKVDIKSTSGPDSVLRFFKDLNFTQTQIAHVISYNPLIITLNVEKILKPKIQFLLDMGFCDSEIPDFVFLSPHVLCRSLETQIAPTIRFIKSLVETKENLVKVLRGSRWLISFDVETRIQPNITLLKAHGVSDPQIFDILTKKPRILTMRCDSLEDLIGRVEEFGFKVGSRMFVIALFAMCNNSRPVWDAKMKLLKDYGCSEEGILQTFRRMPTYLASSEKRIKTGMDFLVNQLKLTPSEIVSCPGLFIYSLERRIIPRSRVWTILRSIDVMKENTKFIYMLKPNEDIFLQKYVEKYKDSAPLLLKAYKNDIDK